MHVPNLKYRKSMHVHNIYKKKKAHRKHRNELTQLLIENFHYKIRSEICQQIICRSFQDSNVFVTKQYMRNYMIKNVINNALLSIIICVFAISHLVLVFNVHNVNNQINIVMVICWIPHFLEKNKTYREQQIINRKYIVKTNTTKFITGFIYIC